MDGGVAHPLHLHRTYEAAEVVFYVPHAAQADDATLIKFVTEGDGAIGEGYLAIVVEREGVQVGGVKHPVVREHPVVGIAGAKARCCVDDVAGIVVGGVLVGQLGWQLRYIHIHTKPCEGCSQDGTTSTAYLLIALGKRGGQREAARIEHHVSIGKESACVATAKRQLPEGLAIPITAHRMGVRGAIGEFATHNRGVSAEAVLRLLGLAKEALHIAVNTCGNAQIRYATARLEDWRRHQAVAMGRVFCSPLGGVLSESGAYVWTYSKSKRMAHSIGAVSAEEETLQLALLGNDR